jgi:hypothetical protein
MYWNGDTATNLAALPSWPAGYIADWCRTFKNYIIFGGITKAGVKYPSLVLWSNAADPGAVPTAYTSTSTNDAGEDPVENIGALVDALQLGDQLILYGQTGRASMQYVGGNDVFRMPRLPGNDGLRVRGSVVDTPKGHVFLSNGDVMIHNGGECRSIAEGRVRRWIMSTMDSTNSNRAFIVTNPQQDEVWVVFPETGQSNCNKIAAWNWNDDTWAIHEIANVTCGTSGLVASALFGNTWSSDSDSWESDVSTWNQDEASASEARMLIATSTPKIGLCNVGSTDFDVAFAYFAERRGIRPGDDNVTFFVRRSQWDFAGASRRSLTISHGMSKTANGSPSYCSNTFYQGTTDWLNAISSRGRYAAVKFSGNSGQQLSLRTVRLDLRAAGQEHAPAAIPL